MGLFAIRGRRTQPAGPEASESLTPGQRLGLPHRLEAVGEALASGSEGLEAGVVAGEWLARDGVPLEEALDRLRCTWELVRGQQPSFEAVSVLAVAWSDSTVGYLHQMSCEDPMTGLSSRAHLRGRLRDLYRRHPAGEPNLDHALVLCEVAPEHGAADDSFTRAMRLSRIGDVARTVFSQGESVARIGPARVAVLAERDERLGRRVRLLRTMLSGHAGGSAEPRVWIEGLPGSDHTAAMLLDELARS